VYVVTTDGDWIFKHSQIVSTKDFSANVSSLQHVWYLLILLCPSPMSSAWVFTFLATVSQSTPLLQSSTVQSSSHCRPKTQLKSKLSGWWPSHTNLLLFSTELSQEHCLVSQSQSYTKTDGHSASLSWCLAPNCCSWPIFNLSLDSCGFVNVGRPPYREVRSVVNSCSWASPAQSFSGPNHAVLMTIFRCLKFETSPTWRARFPYLFPPGTGQPSYTFRHWVLSRYRNCSLLYSFGTDGTEITLHLLLFIVA
jgi:hypothetical protein